jgi:integrase
MSLYKRQNSSSYYCEITINGKTVIRSTKTSKLVEARRFEAQLREQLYRQVVLGEQQTVSLATAIDGYAKSKIGSTNSQNLKAQLRALQVQLAKVLPLSQELQRLNANHLNKLVSIRRQDNVADGTIRLMLTTLKGVIKWSKAGDYLQPTNLVFPRLRISNQRTRTLSETEELHLLEILRCNKNPDDFDLVVLLLDTAARLNEIQQLTWDSVDLTTGELHLWRSKTKTETLLKLTERSHEILQRRFANKHDSGLVFPSKKGGIRRTTPKTIQNAYKVAGLDDFCTHSIRHSTASKLVNSGMSLFAVSKVLGHSSVTMSQRYSHLEQNAVADQAVKILNKSSSK